MFKTLDPKSAAAVAYRNARVLQAMIAEMSSLYDGYDAPMEDRCEGGKYALGRLVNLASSEEADRLLPALREASYAMVSYADLLEAVALATRGDPEWWKEPAQRWPAEYEYSRTVDAGRDIVYRRDGQRAV